MENMGPAPSGAAGSGAGCPLRTLGTDLGRLPAPFCPRYYQIGCPASTTGEVRSAETEPPVRVVTQKESLVGGVARLGLCDVRGADGAIAGLRTTSQASEPTSLIFKDKIVQECLFV
jgi:hypothetical protein